MAMAGKMRGAPTLFAILARAQISTVGMPALSICLASVAPQRVPVPQVLVSITPTFPLNCLRMSSAMAAPNFCALLSEVALPAVV